MPKGTGCIGGFEMSILIGMLSLIMVSFSDHSHDLGKADQYKNFKVDGDVVKVVGEFEGGAKIDTSWKKTTELDVHLVRPVLSSDQLFLEGWWIWTEDSFVVVDEGATYCEVSMLYNMPLRCVSSVDSKEYAVLTNSSHSTSSSILVAGENGVVSYGFPFLAVSGHNLSLSKDQIVASMDSEGLFIIDRVSGDLFKLSDCSSDLAQFFVNDSRVILQVESEWGRDGFIRVYDINGEGVEKKSDILNNTLIVQSNQLGEWLCLLSDQHDIYMLNITNLKIYKSKEKQVDLSEKLLLEVVEDNLNLTASICDASGDHIRTFSFDLISD